MLIDSKGDILPAIFVVILGTTWFYGFATMFIFNTRLNIYSSIFTSLLMGTMFLIYYSVEMDQYVFEESDLLIFPILFGFAQGSNNLFLYPLHYPILGICALIPIIIMGVIEIKEYLEERTERKNQETKHLIDILAE